MREVGRVSKEEGEEGGRPLALGSLRSALIRRLISSERGHMLRSNVRGGECRPMLLTPGRRFLRYRPPTAGSFVPGDQPSPHCEWAELIKPHRIIVSKSQRIISHPFEKHKSAFLFSPLDSFPPPPILCIHTPCCPFFSVFFLKGTWLCSSVRAVHWNSKKRPENWEWL